MASMSIYGDSISTYKGYNPPDYEVYYEWYNQVKNKLENVEDTWWGRLMLEYHLDLCVNDSFSGSRVTGGGFPAASDEKRLNNLRRDGVSPDYIFVYIGFNDFGYGVPITGDDEIKQDDGNGFPYFEKAYEHMVKRLCEVYGNSKIFCATLMRTKLHGNGFWQFKEQWGGFAFEEYNRVIRKICRDQKTFNKNLYLADLGSLDMKYDTLDGTHPTAEGHKTIADAWISCISDQLTDDCATQ